MSYVSSKLRATCRDPECVLNTSWPNWDFMQGAFPRGCMPSDIDGLIEISGSFLLIEWKVGAGEHVWEPGPGQMRMYSNLVRRAGFFVLLVHGSREDETDGVICWRWWSPRTGTLGPWRDGTRRALASELKLWSEMAEAR